MQENTLPESAPGLLDGGAAAEGDETPSGATGGETAQAVSDERSDAGSTQDKTESAKERAARYRALVNGEFKDLFTADTQRIIDHRFKETKGLQETLEAQRPVLEKLMARYHAADVDALRAAIEAEETKAQTEVEARRAQWEREAEETRGTYPQFDLEKESADPLFLALLEGGAGVKLAYEAVHLDQLRAQALREAERRLADHIRAQGARPRENGASAQSGIAVRCDVNKLTREQRAQIARRAARGEVITLR